MANLNGLEIFVEDESVNRSIESTDHPTETGLPITSSIQKQPVTLSLKGKIVDNGKQTAAQINSDIIKLQNAGSLITYKGRNIFKNLQIQSYESTHPKDVWGGLEFTMELKEVRIAKPCYVATTNNNSSNSSNSSSSSTQPVLKVGATVVFKGGNVYVSSDAKKPAAKRGRSTCKITIINSRSWAKHPLHLISIDGKKVYGWCDKADVEGIATKTTTAQSSNGTQQVTSGTGTAVYHTVQKGDTVWGLINNKYKSLGKSCNWVISNNPNAFTRKGDPKTLKKGAKLLMGYKS